MFKVSRDGVLLFTGNAILEVNLTGLARQPVNKSTGKTSTIIKIPGALIILISPTIFLLLQHF